MLPILFRTGKVVIFSYPFMASLAFFVGTLIAINIFKKHGVSIKNILGLAISIQISGFLGSRLLFIINNYSQFQAQTGKMFIPSPGGFAFTGGFMLSILTAIIYLRIARLSFWKMSHFAIIPLAAGIFITKIGCFLGGCCYGKETSSFLGVQFPANSPAAYRYGFPHLVHPTQLYEAFSIPAILAIVLLCISPKKQFDGQAFLAFMILYLTARTLNEIVRGDVSHNFVFNLSQTQFLNIVFIFSGIAIYRKLKGSKL